MTLKVTAVKEKHDEIENVCSLFNLSVDLSHYLHLVNSLEIS